MLKGNFFLLCLLLLIACSGGRINGEWSIPTEAISDGEGKGNIPSINEPTFSSVNEINFLEDTSLVLVTQVNNEIKVYPLNILYWHEIVNDRIDNTPIAVTYSTLSGSGIAFDRTVQQQALIFGVSGLLYNANLIFFDRITSSNWSQILRKGVNGLFIDQTLSTLSIIEMNWALCRRIFPDSKVLTVNTGFNRPYSVYPYGEYETDDNLLFDITRSEEVDKLIATRVFKEKMLGVIIDDAVKLYPRSVFAKEGFSIIEDEFKGMPLIVLGSQEHNFTMAYSRLAPSGDTLNFDIKSLENVLIQDNNGTTYNLLGKSIEDTNRQLSAVENNIAFWFFWAVIFNDIEIYE